MKELFKHLLGRIRVFLAAQDVNMEDDDIEDLFFKVVFWLFVAVFYGLSFIGALMLNIFADSIRIVGETYGKGTLLLFALLLYTSASFRVVAPTKLGLRVLLGKELDNVGSGLTFVPLAVCRLITEQRGVIQDELPADPEKIYRGDDDDPHGKTVPEDLQKKGFKPPIRITFSGKNQESKDAKIPDDDPYDRRLTAEVVPFVRWKIINLRRFVQSIGSVKEARRQMEDTVVSLFTQTLTKVSPAVALLNIKKFGEETLEPALDKLVASWGVDVENAQIKAINFSRALNAAVQKVVEAERAKEAAMREGEGIGGREKAILTGRTDGLVHMKDKLGVSGEAVLGAETARKIAGDGDKQGQKMIIAGSGGFSDLVGTVLAVGETLKTKPGEAK